jgi:uncharacterized protein DUF5672/SEC-C motif-containing protein
MKLDLKDITLCAADSANVALSARALALSMERCDFADTVLFSHQPAQGLFRSVNIAPLNSRNDYSEFMMRELPNHIDTAYALIVQWDGYVINADAWTPEFRDYDYIGARWTWFDDGMTVGNGGFSLRSQKLLRALRDPRFAVIPGVNEDELICRDYRATLEREYGIRIAPESIADLFSYERTIPAGPTFGFHGLFNMWRHTEDREMTALVDRLHPYSVESMDYAQTAAQYFLLERSEPLRAFYARLRQRFDLAEITRRFAKFLPAEDLQHCIEKCEVLAGLPSSVRQSPLSAKPGRSDPCPCGSGKRYKHCHGRL